MASLDRIARALGSSQDELLAAIDDAARAARLSDGDQPDADQPGAVLVRASETSWREATRRALSREGWMLGQDGGLRVLGGIDLETGGRATLEELLARLRQGTDDPGLLLGLAKDLLEAVPTSVLQEVGWPIDPRADFDQLWHFARERLGILPQQIRGDTPGGRRVQVIVDCSWKLAREVNLLRVDEGAGHGRTLPTGVSRELALFVVREACSMADFTLGRSIGSSGDAAR